MDPSEYTVGDLFFYSGLFGGILIVYLGLQQLETPVHPFIRIILGIVVGVGLGYILRRSYEARPPRPPQNRRPDDDFDRYGR